jgi:small subunit ribosomal protein S11
MGKKRIITTADGNPSADKQESAEKAAKGATNHLVRGIINISSSYNNTLVYVTDQNGNTVAWTSAGSMGFKGTKKSTPFAATIVAKEATERARRLGLQEAAVVVKGVGPGREAAIRGIASTGIAITSIMDNTPIAHNGVRPKKPRRV